MEGVFQRHDDAVLVEELFVVVCKDKGVIEEGQRPDTEKHVCCVSEQPEFSGIKEPLQARSTLHTRKPPTCTSSASAL